MINKYQYVIIDDSDVDGSILNYYLKESDFLECKAIFTSPKAALVYFESNIADLLFLDIEMPQINGIELLKKIKNRTKCVIFTTCHPEFALEGFNLDCFDYILKPLTKEKIDNCLQKTKKQLDVLYKASLYEKGFKEGELILKSGSRYVHVLPSDIAYLEALKDYTRVVLVNNKSITIYGNLSKTLANENFSDFTRIHKSYAIRLSSIKELKKNEVILSTGFALPLGYSYKKEVQFFLK